MVNDLLDFPAIKQLAEALWRQDAKMHGAAIMIHAAKDDALPEVRFAG